MRAMILAAAVAALAAGGCNDNRFSWFNRSKPADPAATSQPVEAVQQEPVVAEDTAAPVATRPAGSEVVAYVNNQPIYMDELVEVMVEAYGLERTQQLIASQLVDQAAEARNLVATEEEIDAEHAATLDRMFRDITELPQRERLLEQFLVRRSMTRGQWRKTMGRNVLLGKLGDDQVTVSEEELKLEFENRYGRKVIVRHIQCASAADVQQTLRRIRDGADFVALAREVSKARSAKDGGLLPPVGAKATGMPPALRRAAMAMTRPGEISRPVQVGTAYHILYLDRIIAPRQVEFEEVREQLAGSIREEKLKSVKQRIFGELLRKADIQYVHPVLKHQAEQAAKERLP